MRTIRIYLCFIGLLFWQFPVSLPAAQVTVVAASSDETILDTAGLAELGAALGLDSIDALMNRLGYDRIEGDDQLKVILEDPVFVASRAAEAATAAEAPAAAFEAMLFQAMSENITTGYNIIPKGAWPDYAPDHTIIYGHNDLKHLRQLLFLLRLHGLDPAFTIVPKRSAFKLREGWGNTNDSGPRLPDGTAVAQLSEYDLWMEFSDAAAIEHFQALVTRYAKKDSADEPGLLYASWWQPFYRSFISRESMKETREIWVSMQGYKANVLSIVGEESGKLKALQNLSNIWQTEVIPLWVNPSFYRYLEGHYK